MLIALDYDNTWTKAPALWADMIKAFKDKGHSFVCITSREETTANKKELAGSIGQHMPLVFCNHQPKAQQAEQAGYKPDIWIDDRPETIPTQLEQWGGFELYKNGAFVSSFHSIDEAEQAGKNIMRDMSLRNVYLAVYQKNANGKGQPVLEQVRGTGGNQLYPARTSLLNNVKPSSKLRLLLTTGVT